ncbi:hypothetical protein MPH_13881 [Macrophomina phaseolina MS6]|uniref:Uncharacterized protein n=1 Tax=Macrophomina phaseolina (strain MS6) TaxID=1126212 RepID=K2RGA9_MACPH|nr:hypothetical protein MPH_13881 [Macrophomina phaseolina MS6]
MGADTRSLARLRARRTDYHALHTGKPTRQRGNHATIVPDLPSESSESTLDDVIGLLNVIVAQNNQLTERNEALAEQVASNEDEIMRLRSALETSEETQVKMEERMGKMEKQMAALIETTRRNLTSQSQINASYASALKNHARHAANVREHQPSVDASHAGASRDHEHATATVAATSDRARSLRSQH